MRVGELLTVLNKEIDEGKIKLGQKIFMYSDEEGNNINNLVAIERDSKGIYLIPDTALLDI